MAVLLPHATPSILKSEPLIALLSHYIVLSSGKAEVSAPSVTTAAPRATRQDVYVGEFVTSVSGLVVMVYVCVN